MKVLFICSGNKLGHPNNIVFNQAVSLRKEGIDVSFYTIIGKGFWGYLKHVFLLSRFLKTNTFDLLHAHYSFSAFVAALTGKRPLIASLMGSDAYISGLFRIVAYFFYRYVWNVTIVKSREMRDLLNFKNAHIIPNGVDLNVFSISEKETARRKLGLPQDKKIIVFIADPSRYEKNFPLAELAVKLLNRSNVNLIAVHGISNSTIPDFMNAADVLLLTSKWEGSVNVVKEAMACNLPIVSTDVGDVKLNISGIKGCYVTRNSPEDICSKLELALEFNGCTNGREKLILMGLDSESVAKRIVKIYEEIIYAE
ncbi:MAG: glycosyltransferase family 4 protein [Tenuifilaceae bacterium]